MRVIAAYVRGNVLFFAPLRGIFCRLYKIVDNNINV